MQKESFFDGSAALNRPVESLEFPKTQPVFGEERERSGVQVHPDIEVAKTQKVIQELADKLQKEQSLESGLDQKTKALLAAWLQLKAEPELVKGFHDQHETNAHSVLVSLIEHVLPRVIGSGKSMPLLVIDDSLRLKTMLIDTVAAKMKMMSISSEPSPENIYQELEKTIIDVATIMAKQKGL